MSRISIRLNYIYTAVMCQTNALICIKLTHYIKQFWLNIRYNTIPITILYTILLLCLLPILLYICVQVNLCYHSYSSPISMYMMNIMFSFLCFNCDSWSLFIKAVKSSARHLCSIIIEPIKALKKWQSHQCHINISITRFLYWHKGRETRATAQ